MVNINININIIVCVNYNIHITIINVLLLLSLSLSILSSSYYYLHAVDVELGIVHFLEARVDGGCHGPRLGQLAAVQPLVALQEAQVALGGHVDVPPVAGVVLLAGPGHARVRRAHQHLQRVLHLQGVRA